MRILHAVQFFYPAVGGMEEVVMRLSSIMAEKGHQVTVMTSFDERRMGAEVEGVRVEEFRVTGNLAFGLKGEVEKCKEFLRASKFDVIVCFAAQQWTTDIFFSENLLDDVQGKKVFVPTGFSGLGKSLYRDYFQKMKFWLHLFDHNIFLSKNYQDYKFAMEAGLRDFSVIPNGASEKEFSDLEKTNEGDTFKILHIGNHTGQKGHKELLAIYLRANVLNSELIILGHHRLLSRCFFRCFLTSVLLNLYFCLTKAKKKVTLKEVSRSEVLKYYSEANLFLFPSNIECSPIVLFESMASQTPFLSSPAGNASEIVDMTKAGKLLPAKVAGDGRIVVDVGEGVKVLEKLFNDKEELRVMGERGHSAWEKFFTWEKIADQYLMVYESLYGGEVDNCTP